MSSSTLIAMAPITEMGRVRNMNVNSRKGRSRAVPARSGRHAPALSLARPTALTCRTLLQRLRLILRDVEDRPEARDLDEPLDARLEVREVDLAAGLADLLEDFHQHRDGAAVHVGD